MATSLVLVVVLLVLLILVKALRTGRRRLREDASAGPQTMVSPGDTAFSAVFVSSNNSASNSYSADPGAACHDSAGTAGACHDGGGSSGH
jgi:hypothetical protein